MPTTPVYALPYPAASDPADVPVDMQELAERIALVLGGALSATPPGSPFEGQLWGLSPTAGVVWVFRYNAGSASAYKWEFVGGPPLYQEQTNFNGSDVTNSTVYIAPPTNAGPDITIPRAGDYDVLIGGQISGQGVLGYAIGGTAASDDDALSGMTTGNNYSAGITRRKTGLAAATLLATRIKNPPANSCTFLRRRMSVTPVRIS